MFQGKKMECLICVGIKKRQRSGMHLLSRVFIGKEGEESLSGCGALDSTASQIKAIFIFVGSAITMACNSMYQLFNLTINEDYLPPHPLTRNILISET